MLALMEKLIEVGYKVDMISHVLPGVWFLTISHGKDVRTMSNHFSSLSSIQVFLEALVDDD